MKAVVQRVSSAQVTVEGEIVGKIDHGLTVLLGVTHDDTEKDIKTIVNKLVHLRIFEDDEQKMNLSLLDVGGSVLSVSQFTLYGDIRKGRRPSFVNAAEPDYAEKLYNEFNEQIRSLGIDVETGRFGAMMEVSLVNDGPVTIIMETVDGKLIE